MMRRRAGVALLAGVLLAGVVAVPGSPAGAQDGGILDVPRLGFEIDPDRGYPGDSVGALVDLADVDSACPTLEEVSDQFGAVVTNSPPDGGPTGGPFAQQLSALSPVAGVAVPDDPAAVLAHLDATYPTWNTPGFGFPRPSGDVITLEWWQSFFMRDGGLFVNANDFFGDYMGYGASESVWKALAYFSGLVSADVEQVYEQLFVLTFVDPVTQDLVGQTSSFSLEDGQGVLEVPDLEPGLWAVAGACVLPEITDADMFADAMAIGTPAMQELMDQGMPSVGGSPFNDWCADPPGPLGVECNMNAMQYFAELLLPELVVPQALGIDFYCILNEDGFCATPPDPVGLLEELSEEELAEFADLEAGADGAGTGSDVDAELLTEAVTAAPSFTG